MKIQELITLLNKSYSQFHVVKICKEILDKNNFIQLDEKSKFNLEYGKNYYVTRNDSSIIAFKIPAEPAYFRFQVVASHTDSPTFKLKQNPIFKSGNYVSLNVEPYGGMIMSSWLDRPLSIAGRVVVRENNELKSHIVNVDKNLLFIPNVAIHMNRNINSGYEYNPAVDLIPLLSKDNMTLNSLFDNQFQEIVAHDLYLYNRDEARLCGMNDEFLSSPKIDNLTSVYTSLFALLNSENSDTINVFVAFDNEEVGSRTRQGAGSTFLADTLKRISINLKIDEESYLMSIAKSTLISVDNGHAIHPNHPEYSDKNPVILGEGPIIKYNASESYTTNALSSSLVQTIAKEAGVKIQHFENKSNIRGGSTLGNISIGQISILSADIGVAQLAMHSANEMCSTNDILDLYNLLLNYFNTNIL